MVAALGWSDPGERVRDNLRSRAGCEEKGRVHTDETVLRDFESWCGNVLADELRIFLGHFVVGHG